MGRLARLLARLERILALSESLLAELTGPAFDEALLENCRAFRWDSERGPGRLVPVPEPARFDLGDLVGVDGAVANLVRNTEQFLHGLPFNHVLLYGDRGTGKSSAVRGLLERFGGQGLRLVEVERRDLVHLPRVLAAIRQYGAGRGYASRALAGAGRARFVIYCDDLSFGPGESGYRELKAVLEGSIDAPPENVCLVATSNRRHLVPQTMADNRAAELDEQNELHLGEALEEKLALSDRFGLKIGFYCFDQATYLAIVEHYLVREEIGLGLEEVREEALRWAQRNASRTGRSARQFVNDLAGRRALEKKRARP
ncbi:MAG: ATP-binding protein [Deltaproteobacteria bacterium]|nr:ATP-binding protein [Deltaproteobacteria bacterium]